MIVYWRGVDWQADIETPGGPGLSGIDVTSLEVADVPDPEEWAEFSPLAPKDWLDGGGGDDIDLLATIELAHAEAVRDGDDDYRRCGFDD